MNNNHTHTQSLFASLSVIQCQVTKYMNEKRDMMSSEQRVVFMCVMCARRRIRSRMKLESKLRRRARTSTRIYKETIHNLKTPKIYLTLEHEH